MALSSGTQDSASFGFMLMLKKSAVGIFMQGLQNTLQKVSKPIDNMLMSAEVIPNLKRFLIILQGIHCIQ